MKVLIVGCGFLGANLAKVLTAYQHEVLLSSRHRPDAEYLWQELDATNYLACKRVCQKFAPEVIILAHGPSDITWCEDNSEYVFNAHSQISSNFAELAKNSLVILISTDNIFSGEKTLYFESDHVDPINAYGRAKLAAEQILQKNAANLLIVRTSLIYGWDNPNKDTWLNFFSLCVQNLLANKTLSVPDDHFNTPVWVVNFANIIRIMLENKFQGLCHLGGPDRVSRYHWAQIIAEAFACDINLITRMNKSSSRYACRPKNACLGSRSSLLSNTSVLGLKEVAAILKESAPNWVKGRK